MEMEQFSLCWNNFHDNLSLGFHTLLQNEDLVDVTLAAEGKYLKAHKIVLSICSPYFKELFRVNPCKHPIVILQDISYNALCNLLQFMYQGKVNVGQDEVQTFMRVAEILKIKGLTDIREGADISKLSTDKNSYASCLNNKQSLEGRHARNITMPSQHLKLIESSPTEKSILQPPTKGLYKNDSFPCISDYLPKTAVNIKQEPTDLTDADDIQEDSSQDHSMDVASILDATLGELTDSKTLPTDMLNPESSHRAEKKKKRGRCCYCDRKKNRATKYFCIKCGKYMCLQHCTYLCKECFYLNSI